MENSNETRNSWIAGGAITALHLFCILFLSQHFPFILLEVAVFAILAVLAYTHLISWTPVLCLITIAGFLVAEPAVGFGYGIWIVLIPLMVLVNRGYSLRALFGLGLWIGLFIASGIYAWIWQSMINFFEFSGPVAFLFFLLTTLLIGLQIPVALILTAFIVRRLLVPVFLVMPIIYTAVEFWWPLPMPIDLVLGFIEQPLLLQPVDIFGTHGVTFLVAIVSAGLYAAGDFARRHRRKEALLALSVAAAALVFHLGYGLWGMEHYRPNSAEQASIDIGIVQPVAPLKILNDQKELQQEIAKRLEELSLRVAKEETPDLLLWPEGAGAFASRTPTFNPAYMQAVVNVQKKTSATLVVHNVEFEREEATGKLRYYSAVSYIEPIGRTTQSYHKNILMPFSEYLPMEDRFPILREWFPQARSVLPSKSPRLLEGPGGEFAPLICYEVLFPEYVRRLVGEEATYIVNLTNDRWYGERQQPPQHQSFAILRAVENRKPVARSTNSGISALIDARGIIGAADATGVMEVTALRGELTPREGTTVYTRFGDPLSRWLLSPATLILLLAATIRSRRNGKESGARPPAPPPSGRGAKKHKKRV